MNKNIRIIDLSGLNKCDIKQVANYLVEHCDCKIIHCEKINECALRKVCVLTNIIKY